MESARSEEKISWPAWLGALLSFIPLFGVLAGIISIAYGLSTRRRGRFWIVGIGAFGIISTVIIYGELFKQMYHPTGMMAQAQSQLMSEHILPDLVRRLEYSKIQTGGYPKRLQDLGPEVDSIVKLQEHVGVGPIVYGRALDGKTYCLLAAGPDHQTQTADDVFPKIEPAEAARIGYRRCPAK